MDSSTTTTGSDTVQHVNKKSSDELLRKFAQVGSDSAGKKELVRASKRRKRSSRARRESEYCCRSPSNNGIGDGGGGSLVERKWLLLPPTAATTTRRSALLRHLSNNRSLFGTIEKTWRRTVQGASRVFMEKHHHYNRHRRLINDVA